MANAFLDTNVLLYLLASGPKTQRAREVYVEGSVISVQVLNEFVNIAQRKHARPWADINASLERFKSDFDVEPLTVDIHAVAVKVAARYSLNIYDATIIAAALSAGSEVLYSEDIQDGMRIEGLSIRNPFVGLSA